MNILPKRHLVERALDGIQYNRPLKWVERDTGIPLYEIRTIARVAGRKGSERVDLDTYDKVEQAVEDGWSLSEISRTYGWRTNTIQKWFPRSGWKQGGSSEHIAYVTGLRMMEEGNYA